MIIDIEISTHIQTYALINVETVCQGQHIAIYMQKKMAIEECQYADKMCERNLILKQDFIVLTHK